MGDYDNQATLLYPFKTERYPKPLTKPVGIDMCIVKEIQELWDQGIETEESCCGHNKAPGYISVTHRFVGTMLSLGYKQLANPCEFKPKSI